MLNKYDYQNIGIIKSTAEKVFGGNCVFGEIQLLDRPFTEFNLPMKLYNTFDITLEYERSTVGIMVKTSQGYIGLSRLTDQQVFKGLKSCIPENLLHNFKVLDELIKNNKTT